LTSPTPSIRSLSSDLIDVSSIDFRRVAQLSGSAMARSLLRIQSELERPQERRRRLPVGDVTRHHPTEETR